MYYKGTLIADSRYKFNRNDIESKIIYLRKKYPISNNTFTTKNPYPKNFFLL